MIFLGIDGGGTKTKFTMINEKEEIIASVEKGTSHYNQVGFDGVKNVLEDGLKEIVEKGQIAYKDINKVCVGLAGYGEVKDIAIRLEKVVDEVFENIEVKLCNDVQIAHAGALAGEDGIVIISGTGSIGYAVNNGERTRVGGWGYTIGDEGSAYWIGKKAIEYFSKEADGRLEKGELYRLIMKKLNLKDEYDLIKYINNDIKASRSEIAKFAPICAIAANNGDENAKEIFKQSGFELAGLINTLSNKFSSDKIAASYIGGVFKSGELIITQIEKNIDKRINLKAPKYYPDMGACLIAKK